MSQKRHHHFDVLLLALLFAGSSWCGAQTAPIVPEKIPAPDPKKTLGEYQAELVKFWSGPATQPMAAKQQDNVNKAPGEVAQRPTAVTPPSGFSDRVTET